MNHVLEAEGIIIGAKGSSSEKSAPCSKVQDMLPSGPLLTQRESWNLVAHFSSLIFCTLEIISSTEREVNLEFSIVMTAYFKTRALSKKHWRKESSYCSPRNSVNVMTLMRHITLMTGPA